MELVGGATHQKMIFFVNSPFIDLARSIVLRWIAGKPGFGNQFVLVDTSRPPPGTRYYQLQMS